MGTLRPPYQQKYIFSALGSNSVLKPKVAKIPIQNRAILGLGCALVRLRRLKQGMLCLARPRVVFPGSVINRSSAQNILVGGSAPGGLRRVPQ